MSAPSITSTPPGTAPTRSGPVSPLRRRICLATVLVCLPYTLLKVAWVAGWSVGVSVDGFTDTTRVANAVTAGLDLGAILLAVMFVAPWGRRVPAFLVAFPAWVGTGLLAPVVLGFLVGTPLQLLTGGANPFTGDDAVSPWVFGLVYGGFVLQAVLLLPGFVLYARDRWPVVTDGGRGSLGAGPARPLQTILAGFFIVAAVAFAGLQLAWAAGASGPDPSLNLPQRTLFLESALAALASAVATAGLVRGERLTRPRLGLIWLGSGIVFTSSLNETLRNVATGPGSWGDSSAGAGERTLLLFILLSALGGAIGGAMRLVEEEVGTDRPPRGEAGQHGRRAEPSRDDDGVGDGRSGRARACAESPASGAAAPP